MANTSLQAHPYIVNGLLMQRAWECPSNKLIKENICRILRENQTQPAGLLKQSIEDGWSNPGDPCDLVKIPDRRFYPVVTNEFNALALHILDRFSKDTENMLMTKNFEYDIVISVEEGENPTLMQQRAESYLTYVETTLDTWGECAPQDLVYGWRNVANVEPLVERCEIVGGGVLPKNQLPGMAKDAVGALPFIKLLVDLKLQASFQA